MKNKGFTLIELLAVIIILAVIALIATPIVLNIIENARKGAAKSSAYGYIDGVKLFYADTILDGNNFILDGTFNVDASGKLSDNNIELDGTKPSGGYLKYTKGRVTEGCLTISEYKVTIVNSEVTKVEKGSCGEATPSTPTYEVYEDGEVVYFDVKTGTTCSNYVASNSTTGYNGTNPSEGQTSCLKFYAFLDSADRDTVNLILDHNTTAQIAWYASGKNNLLGPDEAFLNQLNTDTSSWNGVVTLTSNDNYTPAKMYEDNNPYTINYNGYKARLISAEEVMKIVFKTIVDNSGLTDDYFDTNCSSGCATGTNSYAWLFDNLGYAGVNSCTKWGCNLGLNSDPFGYWTSSPYVSSSNSAWFVYCSGLLYNYDTFDPYYGIRPVVKVLKSKLS